LGAFAFPPDGAPPPRLAARPAFFLLLAIGWDSFVLSALPRPPPLSLHGSPVVSNQTQVMWARRGPHDP
jgi:hypothetical protein